MKPSSIRDVAEGHLCCGCGVCTYLEPETITMVNVTSRGLRPLVAEGATTDAEVLQVCPGAGLGHEYDRADPGLIDTVSDIWGPVRAVWEGYATDTQTRWSGSSAGAATVLALHCIENEEMKGVLHTTSDPDQPHLNRTVFSTRRDELLAATGSRYAPASPCDRLDLIESADGPCVFIGKPCDVAAAESARRLRPQLDANLGLTVALFCAGTPSTSGTLEMLEAMGVDDLSQVRNLRYRGNGWPGSATAELVDGTTTTLTYNESWGAILQRHRQWRCYVCADHTGEFADVAVGDPWYRQIEDNDPGRSLIVARTPRGKRAVEAAIQAGLLTAWPVSADLIAQSQPNLAKTRGAVWARVWVCRLLGVDAPVYRNMPMAKAWVHHLTAKEKLSSLGGTVKRIFRKKLRHRVPVDVQAGRRELKRST